MLVVAAVLAGSLTAAFADELQPSIVIPKMRHDFGRVFERDKFEYDFIVKNRGTADLVIESVKPG
jgi:hypothetical protein